MPVEQLSGTIVVIIIAVGVQVCIMLSIFAKRQIMRFTLRNRRGPHTHLAQGAPKSLRRECDRCLDYIPFIRYEPRPSVASDTPSDLSEVADPRLAAVQRFHRLELDLSTDLGLGSTRLPGASARIFLVRVAAAWAGSLSSADLHLVHVACDGYEHARHHYGRFGQEELQAFLSNLARLEEVLRRCRSRSSPSSALKASPRPGAVRRTTSNGTSDGAKAKAVSFMQRRGSKSPLLPDATEL